MFSPNNPSKTREIVYREKRQFPFVAILVGIISGPVVRERSYDTICTVHAPNTHIHEGMNGC